jgi:opacity protein-like surface antigen
MFRECTNREQEISSKRLIAQLNDSLQSYRDKEGKMISKISSIEVDNMSFFKQLEVKDKTIKELQKLVKKGTLTASIVKTETKVDTIFKTVKIKDTLNLTFETDFNLKDWIWGTVAMNKDSTALRLFTRDQYDITLSKEKDGTYVNVINHNPFSTTQEVRSVYKLPKTKKWGLNISAGYGITPEGFKPYIGIGLGRTLINL